VVAKISPKKELEILRKANLEKQRKASLKSNEEKAAARERAAEVAKQRLKKSSHTTDTLTPQIINKSTNSKRFRIKARQRKEFEQKIIALFNVHKRLTPAKIADILDLSFERDSIDRALITSVLKALTSKDLIVNNGGQYVQPFRAQPNIEKDMVGVVEKGPNGTYFDPANPEHDKLPLTNCDVPNGTVVTARVNDASEMSATVMTEHGLFETAKGLCTLTALNKGIPIDFSDAVLQEVANAEVPSISGNRTDMRHIPFLTIDPDTAKDFDDAICVRKHGRNTRLMIAIADVAHYVKPGMEVYDEAIRRGNSTYLPGLTIPMLPESLSNNLCSLRPMQDRAAFVMTVDINSDGEIVDYSSALALIRSRARLTYDQVQQAIEGGTEDPKTLELYNKYISKAVEAYKILLAERENRGALDLNVKEQRMDITAENGFNLRLEQGNASHGLIEESMILANRAAIATLLDRGSNVVVRSHAGPNERLLSEKIPQLEKWGMVIDKDMTAEEMVHDIAKQAKGHKNGDKIRRTLIRVQSMAGYKAEPSRHFALALDNYGHFTSPIRRAADLIVHHLMQGGAQKYPEAFSKEKLEEDVKNWNETERRSEDAERECYQRLAARWVQGNMTERFNAKVIAIGDQEISVRVDYPSIVTDIVVQSTGPYKMGDQIEIQPAKANPVTGILEFKIASDKDSKSIARKKAEEENRLQQGRHPRMKSARTAPQVALVVRG
jgi:VacB/RNase II family 3'-5' exoribonuclease